MRDDKRAAREHGRQPILTGFSPLPGDAGSSAQWAAGIAVVGGGDWPMHGMRSRSKCLTAAVIAVTLVDCWRPYSRRLRNTMCGI
jgi:hypothetical protein